MGYQTIPFVIAYQNELVKDRIWFDGGINGPYLSYRPAFPMDWVTSPRGYTAGRRVLRARVRDLRDHPAMRGPELMKKLNTRRQWQAMDEFLCQVCGKLARDAGTGRIPWLITATVFERTGVESGRTNTPPTCWACVPKAIAECPMLGQNVSLYTASRVSSVGVLADVYKPSSDGQPMPYMRNAFVSWMNTEVHASSLAVAQVVELHGMVPVAAKDLARHLEQHGQVTG